ncbi:ATP-dependent (S)-NAD(P)H-hydrate dehydratase [Diaphorina citri]|uniref:ATP-dependent (S)-NAD(P)H-hydrate dehydratase n=1 Tax=Diaphorina citri TaxID=121845 RepID=A0A3Q0JCD2_DIACI|nr:ATP-dependent (S)-NAD(P)H-hydrate dehydratase [Diaphorina citri]
MGGILQCATVTLSIYVCSEGAVPILKNYSPELIVLPHYLDRNDSVDHIMYWMNRMHSVLIGPGLGTEPLVQSNVISIIHKLKAANLNVPLVIDADGLKLVAEHPGLIQDYRGPVYLTPNKREYENLLSGSEVNAAYIKQARLSMKFLACILSLWFCRLESALIQKRTATINTTMIGPGLGTEPLVQSNVISIIHKLKAANLNVPLVIDADGLKLVAEHPGLIQDYRGPVYLTPNKREYENLLSGSEVNAAYIKQGHPNLTVIVKGHEDVIKNNQISLTCKEGNSWRRCGGQGDLVAGTLATFAHYAALKEQNATGHQGWKALAGLCACAVVRRSNLLAFQIKRRSMVATDMLDQLHVALKQYFRNW